MEDLVDNFEIESHGYMLLEEELIEPLEIKKNKMKIIELFIFVNLKIYKLVWPICNLKKKRENSLFI